jgi:predicted DNA-binding transcriptional regulator AlpA
MTAARCFTFREDLVGAEALAEFLQRSPKAICDLKYRGVLPPAIRIGGRIYWFATDIEAWLQENKEVV